MKSIVKRISRLLGGITLLAIVLFSGLSIPKIATATYEQDTCSAMLDVVIVFDRSSSMMADNPLPNPQPLGDAQSATVSFIDILDDVDDRVGLVDFENTAVLTNGLTYNHAAVSTNVELDWLGSWTNTADGIDEGHAELMNNGRDDAKKVIILLSDGNPTLPLNGGGYDPNYARDAAYAEANEAKEDGVIIYTIGFGGQVNNTIMETIASDSSNYYFAPTSGDLESAYMALASDLCEPDTVTLTASKVVCENESLLPNWSGQDINITENTATDFVAENQGCSLESGWSFQWGDQNVSNPGGDYYGEVTGDGWTTFGPTDESGVVTTSVDITGMTQIRAREVLQEGYIPFTYPPVDNDESAEFYCSNDVVHYDNFDFITNLTEGETYYCVAFNAPEVINTQPVITVNPTSTTIVAGDSFDPMSGYATANDLEDGDITGDIVASSSVDTSVVGTYYVDYDVEDSEGLAADTKTLTVIVEEPVVPPYYGPYCGDGEVNQLWEQCDSGNDSQAVGCSEQCQVIGTPTCSEDVFAKVTVTNVQNKKAAANMTEDIFLGTSTLPIPSGVWTAVYYGGSYINDDSIEGYENVPGLAVQRDNGSVTIRHYGMLEGGAREHSEGNIEFYNAGTLSIENDTSGNNKMENWGPNMVAEMAINAGKDAAWISGTTISNFWMTVTVADDSYFTRYELPPVCEDPEENITIVHTKIVCDDEQYLPNWGAGDNVTAIDSTTVANFLADVNAEETRCSVVDWPAQWAPNGTGNPGDNSGEAGGNWTTFSGTTQIDLAQLSSSQRNRIWVREVWNDQYIPFSGATTTLDNSAETYCYNDVLKYDNYDAISNPVADETYYCVSFNAPVEVPPQCVVEGHKYDYDKETGIEGWTIGLAEVNVCQNDDDAWADFVVDYSPEGDIMSDRDDPNQALGVAERSQGYDFVSLGRGGNLTLGFDNLILNGEGDDIEVVETTWGNQTCDSYGETADVSASQDGITWEYLGQTCLDGTFDLGNLPWAKYVKIADVTVDSRSSDGYDVDGVRALNCGYDYNVVATTITDADGAYCFNGIEDGDYVVFETTSETGWHIQEVYVNGSLSLFHTDSFFDVFVDVRVDGDLVTNIDFYNQADLVNHAPEITLATSTLHLVVGDSFDPMDGHATTSDIDGDDVTLYASSTVDTNATGTYAVLYTAEDEHGLWATPKTLTVIVGEGEVAENQKPVITLSDSTLNLNVGDSFDPMSGYATANDLEDGDITGDIVASSSVDTSVVGTYYVDYDVEDSEGLAADTKTLMVIVTQVSSGGCVSNCGGGGGYIPQILTITDETVEYLGGGEAKVTWKTNLLSTSQVVYGDETIVSVGSAPLYGYDSMTEEDAALVTSHSMIVTGLEDGKQYWFRPVSDKSFTAEKYGKEVTYTFVTVPGQCNYLLEYIQLGADNNPVEVEKLEVFLNDFEGENLEVNGIYEQVDYDAVLRFQDKYFGDILGPWGHNAPTGYVYITTKKKINELYCKREFPLTLFQENEIAAFNAFLNAQSNVSVEGLGDVDVNNVVGLGENEGSEDTTLANATDANGDGTEIAKTGGLLAGILDAFGFRKDDKTTSEESDSKVSAEKAGTTTNGELAQDSGVKNLAAVVFGGVMSVATSYWFIFLLAMFAVILFLRIRGAERG